MRPALKSTCCALAILVAADNRLALAETAADANANGIEEITVTARKRDEVLQNVPISITAFSEKALERENVATIEDLHLSIPNVTITQNTGVPGAAQIYIRGIGQDDSTFTAEQGVAVYLDDVLLGRQNGALLDLIDFDRIEILRGPQGTLYGRNTTGGAIKFVTRRPSLSQTRVVADTTFGSYDRFDIRGSFSTPIIDNELAVKFDFIRRSNDGFMTDLTSGDSINNLDRTEGRVSLLWVPGANFQAYVTADYTRDNSGIFLPTPIAKQADGTYAPKFSTFSAQHGVPDTPHEFDGGGLSADLSYDLDWAKIRSITAYRGLWQPLAIDIDGSATVTSGDIIQRLRQNQFSQELQLNSSGDGPLKYTVGFFYFNEKVAMDAQNIFQGTNNRNQQITSSYAGYGEADYQIWDGVSITAGGRYSLDEKTMDTAAWSRSTGAQLFNLTGLDHSWSRFTPKAGIDWQINPDLLAYASWAKGYKSGGFISGRPSSVSQATGVFSPEKVETTEIGIKSEWLDHRLRVNADYFYSDYTNLQLSFLANGQYNVTTANARIQGEELEIMASPVTGLTFNGILGLLDAKYTKIPLNPFTGAAVGGLFAAAHLKQIPSVNYKIGVNYNLPIDGRGAIDFNADYTWNDEIWRNTANTPSIVSPPVGVLDAQIAYSTADERWRIGVGGRNITNQIYWIQGVANLSRFYAEPATWYLNIKYRL